MASDSDRPLPGAAPFAPAGIELHPHAAAVLGPALGAGPSHAYLFHGPAGTGKRALARAFAAALLSEGAVSPEAVHERVLRGSHPDLTWVRPSGAAEMLVADIEQPVVAAAVMTPFEASRRVFVIESVETMNDQTANRLLKTLEEPASFVHLLLLSDRIQDVLPTIVSRCQLVRFDPSPAEHIESALQGVPQPLARACARLALGDGVLAARLSSEEGTRLRAAGESFARRALGGQTQERPWTGLLESARAAGSEAGERVAESIASELELIPARERKRHEREGLDARRRGERRARTATLDLGLRLAELWLRDVLCIAEGAPELVYAVDRLEQLEQDAGETSAPALVRAIELVGAARLSLSVNVSEELAMEGLAYAIQSL
jgi:DNA polymerase III subunit delta'